VTATVNGRWTRSSYDGLGRTLRVETGTGTGGSATVLSIVDTEYVACGCTPMGKVGRVSRPYAPGGTVYFPLPLVLTTEKDTEQPGMAWRVLVEPDRNCSSESSVPAD